MGGVFQTLTGTSVEYYPSLSHLSAVAEGAWLYNHSAWKISLLKEPQKQTNTTKYDQKPNLNKKQEQNPTYLFFKRSLHFCLLPMTACGGMHGFSASLGISGCKLWPTPCYKTHQRFGQPALRQIKFSKHSVSELCYGCHPSSDVFGVGRSYKGQKSCSESKSS